MLSPVIVMAVLSLLVSALAFISGNYWQKRSASTAEMSALEAKFGDYQDRTDRRSLETEERLRVCERERERLYWETQEQAGRISRLVGEKQGLEAEIERLKRP